MDLHATLSKFITTSVGVRYWYLSRRAGRYSFSTASFSKIAKIYGDIYAAMLSDSEAVISAATQLANSNLPAGEVAHLQDFIVLARTCRFFSEVSGDEAPLSIFEELFAVIKNVIEKNSVSDINGYLRSKNLKVSQNFIDLCLVKGIVVDLAFLDSDPVAISSFIATPSSLPWTGGDISLSWQTQNATSVSISGLVNNPNPLPLNGSISLSLSSNNTADDITATYEISASNPASSTSSRASVSVVAKHQTTIGIQMWANTVCSPPENYSSQLFSLPYVVPYIEAFFSYGNADGQTPQGRARATADRIISVRDTMAYFHPGVPFRWAYWPHRFGSDGFIGADDNLFYHRNDRLSNGVSSVFTASGRALFRSQSQAFFSALKPMLDAAGISDPIFLDADYEGGTRGPVATDNWSESRQWHGIIMSDPRSKTELIDGVQTYEQFVSNLIDRDGHPAPTSDLYTHIYDSSERGCQLACVYSSFHASIVDFGLWDTLYQPAKEIWPKVLCGNWNVTSSTPQKLVHGYRFKESPVYTPHFRGMQIASLYGNPTTDANWWPTGLGFNSFNEQLLRFGIDKSAYTDKNELSRKIHASYADYFISGMRSAKPAGDIGISFSWSGPGSWYGVNTFSDASIFPSDYIGATLDYKSHPEVWDEIAASCKRNNVKVIEIFAQNTNKAACDDMYNAFKTRF